MSKAVEVYKEAPDWAQGVALVLTVWTGYKIYKQIGKNRDRREQEEGGKTEKKTVTSEIERYKKAGMKQSYDDSQYIIWANKLQDSMEGTGTNKDNILSIFLKPKNNLDFLLLQKAFGMRNYSTSYYDYGKKTLAQWLEKEDTWGENLIADVNKMLSRDSFNTGRKVTYRF